VRSFETSGISNPGTEAKNPEVLNQLLDDVRAVDGRRRGMFVSLIPHHCHDSSFSWHAHQQSVAGLRKRHLIVFVTDVTHERRDACISDHQKYPLY
jgi:hypothetical protein